jgi:hypothetical protein
MAGPGLAVDLGESIARLANVRFGPKADIEELGSRREKPRDIARGFTQRHRFLEPIVHAEARNIELGAAIHKRCSTIETNTTTIITITITCTLALSRNPGRRF